MVSMKKVLFLLSLCVCISTVGAQDSPIVDEEASQILSTFEEWIVDAQAMSVDFSISITVPGQENIEYKGDLHQAGNAFKLLFGTYIITSDGKTRWVYDSEVNEVYLYDANSADGPSTPMDYLQIYKQENFEYRLADEYAGQGEHCIEFKPTDKYSEYSKARITFDSATDLPTRIELFEKGGVRTDMEISAFREAPVEADEYFKFNTSVYPDIHIEDLRID